jgi:Na+-transporting methylmalonyl-CoA/oxaloacetate decarboxylase gamma subunit
MLCGNGSVATLHPAELFGEAIFILVLGVAQVPVLLVTLPVVAYLY